MSRLKHIFFVTLLLLASLSAKGQIGELRSRLGVGVNGGMAFSTMDFDPTIKQLQHMGKIFGLSLRYTCEKYFTTVCALQTELNYSQLGWKEDILSSEGVVLQDTYERTLNYIQMPLLCRLGWGKESRGLMFFILLGPQLGYYISGSAKQGDTWTLNDNGNPDRPNNVYQQYSMEPDKKFEYF